MITRYTAFYVWNVAYGERKMLWTWKRMMQKSRLQWNKALSKGDAYGYIQTTYSYSEN